MAAVLVNPHLFVYDLLVLAPVLLLLADWVVRNAGHRCKERATAVLIRRVLVVTR